MPDEKLDHYDLLKFFSSDKRNVGRLLIAPEMRVPVFRGKKKLVRTRFPYIRQVIIKRVVAAYSGLLVTVSNCSGNEGTRFSWGKKKKKLVQTLNFKQGCSGAVVIDPGLHDQP